MTFDHEETGEALVLAGQIRDIAVTGAMIIHFPNDRQQPNVHNIAASSVNASKDLYLISEACAHDDISSKEAISTKGSSPKRAR
jgi:hypothetical protein